VIPAQQRTARGAGLPRQAHVKFLDLLRALPLLPDVFNPWLDRDIDHDGRPDAAEVRARQLLAYLSARLRKATVLLVAEAPGYQGAKFSGIAMTSERILLGHVNDVPAEVVFGSLGSRTSRLERHARGWAEPTATIAWKQMLALGYRPEEFVFWNAFPCHPHQPGLHLTNRAPTTAEIASAAHVLPALLALFPQAKLVAVGKVAQHALADMGFSAQMVRHPAHGGAAGFCEQLSALSLSQAPRQSFQ
jgi:hypothetical protein